MLGLCVDKFPQSMIEGLLRFLDLDEKEIRVYMTLNKLGPSAASTVARVSGIQRTSIYDVLNRLQQKNLILSYTQGQMEYFLIDDVGKLVLREKEKVQVAEQAVQLLEHEQIGESGHVRFFKGLESVKEVYGDMMEDVRGDLSGWLDVELLFEKFGAEFEVQTAELRMSQKTNTRLLLVDSQFARQYKKEDKRRNRMTKLLPKNFRLTSSCFLLPGHVYYFDFRNEIPRAIVIHDTYIEETNSQFFELLWNSFT